MQLSAVVIELFKFTTESKDLKQISLLVVAMALLWAA